MSTKGKFLIIADHRPGRSPSQRFRFEQYLDFLSDHGFEHDFSYLLSEEDDRIFYRPGHIQQKAALVLRSAKKRRSDVKRANEYDFIFIQREAFIGASTWVEKQFARSKAKVIFDFDDAIWKLDISEANKKYGWFKNPQKTFKIFQYADVIIAGNDYLAEKAREYNPNVVIIPTTIDTNYHSPRKTPKPENEPVCIGWTGSHTTVKHFRTAEGVLKRLKEKFGERISFRLIGDPSYQHQELGLKGIPWRKETEIEDLQQIDIGIMPLPDDEWSKGKCGFKGLQYMALEIPTVMSPVGVNTQIVRHMENGLLANNEEEWFSALCTLIEDNDLRKRLGKAGRQTIVEKYSVEANKMAYLELFQKLKQP